MTDNTNFCGLDMDAARSAALGKLFERISDVASMPTTAQKLMELTNQDSATADDLAAVIQNDPALVANILKRVNSSYYAVANKVSDIQTAVSMLGFREIRNLAMTIFVGKYFSDSGTHGTYQRTGLWAHCAAVAGSARLLAKVTNCGSPDEAYTAGLLHDFGFILMDQFLNKHFKLVIDRIGPDVATPGVEEELLSFDHAMLGGFVARKWNFPQSTIDAITFHHRPLDYKGEHKKMLAVVTIANYFCTQAGKSSLGVQNLEKPPESLYQAIGLDPAAMEAAAAQMTEAVEKSGSLSAT